MEKMATFLATLIVSAVVNFVAGVGALWALSVFVPAYAPAITWQTAIAALVVVEVFAHLRGEK